MEFKVGDKVKILDRVGDYYNYYPLYVSNMLKYAGTSTSIKEINVNGSPILDNNMYFWDKKAVKLVNEDKYLHPSELKDGDFIKIRNDDCIFIYIFKEYKDNVIYRHVSINLENYRLSTSPFVHWDCSDVDTKITYATEEDKQLLNQALLKEGYVWDNATKKLLSNSYPIISHTQYEISVDSIEEKINKEELNLFPTKKHYQLNFNY